MAQENTKKAEAPLLEKFPVTGDMPPATSQLSEADRRRLEEVYAEVARRRALPQANGTVITPVESVQVEPAKTISPAFRQEIADILISDPRILKLARDAYKIDRRLNATTDGLPKLAAGEEPVLTARQAADYEKIMTFSLMKIREDKVLQDKLGTMNGVEPLLKDIFGAELYQEAKKADETDQRRVQAVAEEVYRRMEQRSADPEKLNKDKIISDTKKRMVEGEELAEFLVKNGEFMAHVRAEKILDEQQFTQTRKNQTLPLPTTATKPTAEDKQRQAQYEAGLKVALADIKKNDVFLFNRLGGQAGVEKLVGEIWTSELYQFVNDEKAKAPAGKKSGALALPVINVVEHSAPSPINSNNIGDIPNLFVKATTYVG